MKQLCSCKTQNFVPRASHLLVLAPGGVKMRDPGNEVVKINETVEKRPLRLEYDDAKERKRKCCPVNAGSVKYLISQK